MGEAIDGPVGKPSHDGLRRSLLGSLRLRAAEVGGLEIGGIRAWRGGTVRGVHDAGEVGSGGRTRSTSLGDFKPEIVLEDSGVVALDPRDASAVAEVNSRPIGALVTVADGCRPAGDRRLSAAGARALDAAASDPVERSL